MKVKDLLNKMDNGACHVLLVDSETGEIFLKTIWYNAIPEEYLDYEVVHICVTDYTLRLVVNAVGNI